MIYLYDYTTDLPDRLLRSYLYEYYGSTCMTTTDLPVRRLRTYQYNYYGSTCTTTTRRLIDTDFDAMGLDYVFDYGLINASQVACNKF